MNDLEIRQQIARALGRQPEGQGERRICLLLGPVLAAGGPAAEQGLVSACDVYERLLARANIAAAPLPPPRRPGG
jgi:hypothetical protein